MRLSKEQIKEFKRLYVKRFGEEFSDEEAYDQGNRLIRLIEAVYKPISKRD